MPSLREVWAGNGRAGPGQQFHVGDSPRRLRKNTSGNSCLCSSRYTPRSMCSSNSNTSRSSRHIRNTMCQHTRGSLLCVTLYPTLHLCISVRLPAVFPCCLRPCGRWSRWQQSRGGGRWRIGIQTIRGGGTTGRRVSTARRGCKS